MSSRALLLLLALAGALCAAPCLAQAPAGPQAGLKYEVRVEAPRSLRGMIEGGVSLERWRDDPQMTPDLLQRLVDEAVGDVRGAVSTEGYFSASVSASIDRSAEPWTVILRVDPGERTVIDHVEIRFSGPATEDAEAAPLLERVRRRWSLPSGAPFRQEAWDAAKQQAVRTVASWRYAAARVASSEARIDPKSAKASLSIQIDSGRPFRFGELEVSGTKRYPEALVRNLNTIQAGDDYDRNRLIVYQRRLLESGYFVSAQANVDPDTTRPEAAPVSVSVIEGSSHQFEAGLGYSTDAGQNADLRYANENVFGSHWRFKSELRVDTKIQNLQLDLDAPPQAGASWNNYFARSRQTDIQNQSTRELAAGIAHNWDAHGQPAALVASAHFEDQSVSGAITDSSHALYLGYRRTLRDTDEVIAPRRGYIAHLEVGGAPSGVSTRGFTRATADASLLVPLGRSDDLVLRGNLGAVGAAERTGIPSSFLFRTGGNETVRGYNFESLGVPLGDAVVGGRYLAVASAEHTHWFGASWGVATFIDAGNAWDSRPFHAAVGYGVGARFRTPAGPIRADLAYGRDTRQWRLHFSVGFVF